MKFLSLKLAITFLVISVMLLPVLACAPKPPSPPPPPPPPPPGGFITVVPAKIDYDTVSKVAAAAKFPIPAMGILGIPIKFIGTGWPPGEVVTIELIVPPTVEIPGVKPGEPVGIGAATADAAGKFEVTMESSAKINFFLRGAWTPILSPDWTKINPLPNGVYIIKAVGLDPGTVDRTIIELELSPPK